MHQSDDAIGRQHVITGPPSLRAVKESLALAKHLRVAIDENSHMGLGPLVAESIRGFIISPRKAQVQRARMARNPLETSNH